MKKVCLLIGEGDSERYFFPKILERKSFASKSLKEGSLSIYNRGDVYWFFPFPPNMGSELGGKSKLKKPITYKLASRYIETNAHIFSGDTYEIHVVAIFDTDGGPPEEMTTAIEDTIKTTGINFSSVTVLSIDIEIESWYFAGLTEDFPYFKDKADSGLKKLLSSRTSNGHNKANFLRYIDLNRMIGAKDISQAVAEYFQENKALEYSASFEKFDSLMKAKALY